MAILFDYNEEFYKKQADGSYKSAKEIVGFIADHIFIPQSVLDVGCGVGTWLKAWREAGVPKIKGIDGNKMPDDSLWVSRNEILERDLEKISNEGSETYDLAMSVETAEHLRQETSKNFVHFLTSSSDIVLFSAAIPYQTGSCHINTQPLSFCQSSRRYSAH